MKVLIDLHYTSHLLIDVQSMEMLEALCGAVSVKPVYGEDATAYAVAETRGPSFSILSTADFNKITLGDSTDE